MNECSIAHCTGTFETLRHHYQGFIFTAECNYTSSCLKLDSLVAMVLNEIHAPVFGIYNIITWLIKDLR